MSESALSVDAFLSEHTALGMERDELADLLNEVIRAAQTSHPEIHIAPPIFAGFLGHHLDDDAPPRSLHRIMTADLYLTCGCSMGLEPALAAFEAQYATIMERAIRRYAAASAIADDILQGVREKLFVGVTSSEKPWTSAAKIAAYAGRGSLKSWLRSIVTRATISRLRVKSVSSEGALLEAALPTPQQDPQLAHLRAQSRGEFQTAFIDALNDLKTRDRTILRLGYVDQLSLREIGELYGVTKATVHRWLDRIRTELRGKIRSLLGERLNMSDNSVDSLVRMMMSRFELNVDSDWPDGES